MQNRNEIPRRSASVPAGLRLDAPAETAPLKSKAPGGGVKDNNCIALGGENVKALREGFTTGSCAAAAALACCLWQREGKCPEHVCIVLPEGRKFAPEIVPHAGGSCGVVKDSGDDPDITNGMEIIASVELLPGDGDIQFCAGEGVGIVTQPGLKIPPGEPAINPVPRKMIEDAVRSAFGGRAARVTVAIPGGAEVARRTFSPRLGIAGGLSVLGTSGVVRPMSAQALRDSLYEELKMRAAQGWRELIFTIGNQDEKALRALFPGMCVVQVSNEVGFMLDAARELGVRRVLLGGHPGKLCKVAAGVMQTHSRYADARREAIIAHLARMGAPATLLDDLFAYGTTDAAVARIHAAGWDGVWTRLAEAARAYCRARVFGEVEISVVFVTAHGRVLGQCMEEDR